MKKWGVLVCALLAGGASGCGGGGGNDHVAPQATATAIGTATTRPTPTRTPDVSQGPKVTFFGLTRADGSLLPASGTASDGSPLFTRTGGSGFALVVEGRPGASGSPVGTSSYTEDLSGLPDLQIVTSRALGNGSSAVCDLLPPNAGGVPAVDPPNLGDPANLRAINDFACRFRDGVGDPLAITDRNNACVLYPSGDYNFVDETSTTEYCSAVSSTFALAVGDTRLTARLRDVAGNVGGSASIVVRVLPQPTPPATATPRATSTPGSGIGPKITFFGIIRADGTEVLPTGEASDGTPVFSRSNGSGFSIVVEGAPGVFGYQVAPSSYQPDLVTFPDLQIQSNRTLGNGSLAVCDITDPRAEGTPVIGGGIPAINPPAFDLSESTIDAVNDFACRFRDGAGNPIARTRAEACVLFSNGDYGFVSTETTTQFCGAVDGVMPFPSGDTLLTARLRDVNGNVGPQEQIIVRIEPAQP